MKLSPRIQEGDYIYMSFWIVIMSSMTGVVVWLLAQIERNTRRR